MSFGAKDTANEIESPCMSRFPSSHHCLDQEEYIIPPVDDTPIEDETIVDHITNLEKLHHTLSVDDIPPNSNFKEGVICKSMNHSLQNFIFERRGCY